MTRRQFAVGVGLGALIAFPLGCASKGKGGKPAPEVTVDEAPKADEKQPDQGGGAGADAGGG